MNKPMNSFAFRSMALMFKVRDLFNHPEKYLKEATITEGKKVLDYGCGPGSFVFPASIMVGNSGKIYATDIHPIAIKMIDKKVKRKNITNIMTIQTDCATNLPKNYVDVVLLYDIIHMLDNIDEILTELARILKLEGILSVSNPHMKEENIIHKITNNSQFKLFGNGEKTFTFKK
ncbi:MAG: class I SAM-dependent methyltransferase [Candidatus Heimdallarchaeota archaeon]|nr:class I SAM-dependent methyltransferase [Candidatus Heimdallarchaeota archaeon]